MHGPNACNYDNSANFDDGSCEYESCIGCMDEGCLQLRPNGHSARSTQVAIILQTATIVMAIVWVQMRT